MADIIRCPHRDEWLDKGKQLKVLTTEAGDYLEICDDCIYDLVAHLLENMPKGTPRLALDAALRSAAEAWG